MMGKSNMKEVISEIIQFLGLSHCQHATVARRIVITWKNTRGVAVQLT